MPVTKPTGVQTQDRKGPLLPAAHFQVFWFQIKAHSFLPGSWDVSLCSPAGAPAWIWHSWTCHPVGELDLSPSRISPSAPQHPNLGDQLLADFQLGSSTP